MLLEPTYQQGNRGVLQVALPPAAGTRLRRAIAEPQSLRREVWAEMFIVAQAVRRLYLGKSEDGKLEHHSSDGKRQLQRAAELLVRLNLRGHCREILRILRL